MARSMIIAALVVGPLLAPVVRTHAQTTGIPVVIAGETVEIGGRRFRLYGIDAPDLRQRCEIRGRGYDCGNVSRTALMDLVAGVEASCVPIPGQPRARCEAGGYDLAEGMVHTGWALAMPRKGTKYARIERARRGLWQGRFTPPWAWKP